MKPLQNNQSQKGGDRVKADEDIIEYSIQQDLTLWISKFMNF